MTESPRVFLFDIDGTLLQTAGAGLAAMTRAFAELFGVSSAYAGFEFGGRTDPSLLREALVLHGLDDGDFGAVVAAFEAAYVRHLARTLHEYHGRILPGAAEVVASLVAVPGAAVGVGTGNFRRGAQMKLAHYGLDRYLTDGGYGSDAENRAELLAIGARRLAQGHAAKLDPGPVVVIGDSPLDIMAAKANGFATVAVATGTSSLRDLELTGADLVLPDLARTEDVLSDLSRLADGAGGEL